MSNLQILEAVIFIIISILLLRVNRKWRWPLLICYIGVVAYLTVIYRSPLESAFYSMSLFDAARKSLEFNGNIIRSLLLGQVSVSNKEGLQGIILNILMFIPLGYLVPVAFPKVRHLWQIGLIGFGLSLAIELTQLCTHLGYAEADDLMHNTIGAVIGWLLYLNFIVFPYYVAPQGIKPPPAE